MFVFLGITIASIINDAPDWIRSFSYPYSIFRDVLSWKRFVGGIPPKRWQEVCLSENSLNGLIRCLSKIVEYFNRVIFDGS